MTVNHPGFIPFNNLCHTFIKHIYNVHEDVHNKLMSARFNTSLQIKMWVYLLCIPEDVTHETDQLCYIVEAVSLQDNLHQWHCLF